MTEPAVARRSSPRGQGGRLREELVAAARDLLIALHPITVPSLRSVARKIGVAPSAVYLHFASVDELIAAVVEDQFDRFRDAIDPGNTERSLEQKAVGYLEWGIANPGAYQLLFESADQLRLGPAADGEFIGWDIIKSIRSSVEKVTAASGQESQLIALRLWSALHGVVSLRIHKLELAWPTTPHDEAAAIVRCWIHQRGGSHA